MKIISQSVNKNNSRITIEFTENGVLSNAEDIATQNNTGFSHNCRIALFKGEGQPRRSFGTISFNKGDHAAALTQFTDTINLGLSE